MAKKPSPTLDTVASIKSDGSRNFLRPADAKGTFTKWRKVTSFFLILIYVGLPWIKIGGHPALFLDVADRRFFIFGLTFAAQDFWLAFFLVSGLGFTLFMVTSVLGRVWCGYTCPQTVFLEHVYRRVERWLEGSVVNQKKLDKMNWGEPEKILRRGTKHVIFIILSLLIAHVFVSYFISIPGLYNWVSHSPTDHWGGFLFVFIMSGILYFNFAWFREQLCLAICPYGRLQSALIDDDSIIIGYDENRGEPRGRPGKDGVGDCINCKRCVAVCPTGIDIRQGLQLECVGCANCIDACDAIMTQLGRPKGLIRYDSLNGFNGKGRRILRPRFFIYIFLMLVGATAMTYAFNSVKPAYMLVTRMSGAPYYQTEEVVRNQFNVRIVNKSDDLQTFSIHIQADAGHDLTKLGDTEHIEVEPVGEEVIPLVVTIPLGEFQDPFQFDVSVQRSDGKFTLTRSVSFLGPNIAGLDKEMVFEE